MDLDLPSEEEEELLQDWIQLWRANWLKAHRLAPFDDSEQGKGHWERVIQSLPEDLQRNLEKKLTPEEVAEVEGSYTGQYLRPMLARQKEAAE